VVTNCLLQIEKYKIEEVFDSHVLWDVCVCKESFITV
jgi:hypothetical protein